MVAHFMEMQLKTILAHYIFFRIGYLQRGGADKLGTESIRYHIYLIPHGNQLQDAFAFAYGWSFKNAGEPRRLYGF